MELRRIQHSADYFAAGRSPDGRQFLIGLQCPDMVVLMFDPDGVCQEVSTRPLTESSCSRRGDGWLVVPEQASSERLVWLQDLGAAPGTIEVQPFSIADREITSRLMPEHLLEYQAHPDNFDGDQRPHLEDALAKWTASGSHVLIWAEEYWISADGEIEST